MISVRGCALACAVGVLVAAAPPPAQAQASRTCFVVVDRTGGSQRQVDQGGGYVHWYSGGGVWAHCRGEATRWYSDSVAWYQNLDRFDMIGNVDFEDATVELEAERASYFLTQERLDASGNAALRNVITGSRLRGPIITYFRQVSGVRDTAVLTASRRPQIEYRSAADSAAAEPYVIVADRVEFRGNTAARAWGRVTIDRSDFHAKGDSARLDTGVGAGLLTGSAQVAGGAEEGYTLDGRAVRFRLDGRDVTWVQAEGAASARSAEWHVVADTVAFDLEHDRVQAGQAWGDSTRARAVSAANTIVADSLAIDAPDQALREVRGIGTARAWSQRDSLDTDPDWVAGDSVIASFAPDSAGRSALAAIIAIGTARARYRVYPEGATEPDLSYSRGDRIVARFANEQLLRVDITGATDGVYLEAERRRRP
jgi:hypothetical protein